MESELFLAILSSMAKGESASISENSKWSIKRRFQNGTFKLSYTPYGYDWDGENMIINPAQAAVVKRIFADILSGKVPMQLTKLQLQSLFLPNRHLRRMWQNIPKTPLEQSWSQIYCLALHQQAGIHWTGMPCQNHQRTGSSGCCRQGNQPDAWRQK